MAKNKNQHFVPQYYLRPFSFDGGKRLRLLHLGTGRVVLEAPLKSQCADAYFYGKDLVTEGALKNLEGEEATMLSDVIRNERLPNWPERFRLYAIVSMLHLRTRRSVLALQRGATATLTEMARRMAKKGLLPLPQGCPPEALTVRDKNVPAQAVMHGFDMMPFLCDLEMRLLKAKTRREFYTSDHPVVAVNQALQDRYPGRSTTGLATRGLQMFLPLNPNLCLVLFDAACYRIGRPKSASSQYLAKLIWTL